MNPAQTLKTRLQWRWRRWQGWRQEGPFPRPNTPNLLLCGPGITPDNEWGRHVLVRTGRTAFLPARNLDGPGPSETVVVCAPDRTSIMAALQHARQVGVNIQLVQRADRHRRLRCNSPLKAGMSLARAADYIERIFSYSEDYGDANSESREG